MCHLQDILFLVVSDDIITAKKDFIASCPDDCRFVHADTKEQYVMRGSERKRLEKAELVEWQIGEKVFF